MKDEKITTDDFSTNVSDRLVEFSAAAVCDCKAVWNGAN